MKKLLAIVLTVAIMAMCTVPVIAADAIPAVAQKVATVKVLKGDGSGVTTEYLAKQTTRIQGAIILLRLLGLEDTALFEGGPNNFSDVISGIWYQKYTAYLKANPGVGFEGYPDGEFKATLGMTSQAIYKVLLVALGYTYNVDFTWNTVFAKADSVGMKNFKKDNPINNYQLAIAIDSAFTATVKGSSQTLIEKLVSEGVIDAADAQSAGYVVPLSIVSATATGVKEITVTFNKAVPSGTAITFKKDAISYAVSTSWSTDAKTLTISRTVAFSPATYTVTVGTLVAPVAVSAETITNITIGATSLYAVSTAQSLDIVIYNQYGEDITTTTNLANLVGTVRNIDKNISGVYNSGNANIDGAVVDNMISVVLLHTTTNIMTSVTIPVIEAPEASNFTLTGTVYAYNSTTSTKGSAVSGALVEGTTYVIGYSYSDQYNTDIALTNADLADDITFISNNTALLNTTSNITISNGLILYTVPSITVVNEGAVTLSAAYNPGPYFTQITMSVVSNDIVPTTLTIDAPATTFKAGTSVNLNFVLLDQNNARITTLTTIDALDSIVSFNSINPTVIANDAFVFGADGTLTVTAAGSGSTSVYYYMNGIQQGVINFVTSAAPVATSIIGLTNLNLAMEVGATQATTAANLTVIDQYGDTMTYTDTYIITQVDGSAYVTTTGNSFSSIAEGTANFSVILGADTNSMFTFSIKGVAATSITSYTIGAFDTFYVTSDATYNQAIVLTGKTADGTSVQLLDTASKIDSYTFSTSAGQSSSNWALVGGNTVSAITAAETSSVLRLFQGVTEIASATITSLTTAPTATTVSAIATPLDITSTNGTDITALLFANLTATDQYGVAHTITVADGIWTVSNTAAATASASGVIYVAATDDVTFAFVTYSGGYTSFIIDLK